MNKNIKKILSLAVTLILVFSFSIVSNAQGTTSISVSNASIGVGDTTTVSVTASSTGTVTVKYTASILNLDSCTASGYSSEGNTITFSGTSGDIVFSASDEGTASIIVSSSSCSGSSTTISVSGTGSATTEDTTDATEETAEADTTDVESVEVTSATTSSSTGYLNESGGFDIDGVSYVVSERYSDEEIPSGFSKVSLSIGSGTYSELSNGNITIIYLKPADNTEGSGEFYVYDADASSVVKFQMLGSASSYVIIGTPDSVPSSIYSATLTTDTITCTAYTLDGSEFYYVYGIGSDGNTGWYMYDTTTGNVSRADATLLNATVSSEETDEDSETSTYDATMVLKDKLSKLRKIISFLIVVCVILVFVIVNYIIKKKNNGDEEDTDDIFAKSPAKNTGSSRKSPRSIVFGNYEDESESDEDDEEDYDDNEDDDEEENDKHNKNNKGGGTGSGLNMMDLNDL